MQIAIEFNLMSGTYLRAWLSSSQQAIDGQIEHSEIARSSLNLQLAPNRPHVFGRSSGFAPVSLPLLRVRGAKPKGSDLEGLAWSCSSIAEDDQPVPTGSLVHQ
jgi:hypothetical protein